MKTSCKHISASSLLVVLFFMMLTSLTIATIYSVTSTHMNVSKRTVDRSIAVVYADGVLDSLFDQWRNALANVPATAPQADRTQGLSTTALRALLSPPDSTTLPPPVNVSLSSWSVTALDPLYKTSTDASGRPIVENGTNSTLRVRVYYNASATVQFRSSTGQNTATVQRIFCRAGRNIFDNFFFGTQPNVEFHPGPDMYINGTVYVQGDLYTAHDSLHFLQDVTFTGKQVLDYRTEDPRYSTTPNSNSPDITNGGLGNNWSLSDPPHVGSTQKLFDVPTSSLDPKFLDDPNSNDSDTVAPNDNNPNNNGYREIIKEVTDSSKTDPLQLDAVDNERLSVSADYRIYVNTDTNNTTTTVTVYKGQSTTPLSTGSTEYAAIKGSLATNNAMYDYREGDYVRMVTVDVSKINAAISSSKITDNAGGTGGAGGDGYLFYVVDSSYNNQIKQLVVHDSTNTNADTLVTSNGKRGVRLINGASLPSAGLSVVTPHPIYIQGDYNTGTTSSSKPASNTASSYTPPTDTPSSIVSGYQKAPAAVAGDAVNILSNSWNDYNSLNGSNTTPNASATTVNTAIVAGNVPTTTSSYSGGIENFTRFHENWTNVYFTIYGSMSQLYDSEQSKGPWTSARYNAPNRRWYYDTLFQNANPPGFRIAHTYVRGNRIQN